MSTFELALEKLTGALGGGNGRPPQPQAPSPADPFQEALTALTTALKSSGQSSEREGSRQPVNAMMRAPSPGLPAEAATGGMRAPANALAAASGIKQGSLK